MMAKNRRHRISSVVQFMELLEKIERSSAGDFIPDEWDETVITKFNIPPPTVKHRLKSFINNLKSFLGR
jgi:hypothetical protein